MKEFDHLDLPVPTPKKPERLGYSIKCLGPDCDRKVYPKTKFERLCHVCIEHDVYSAGLNPED